MGGGLAAIGAFVLLGLAVGAVVVRYRRSRGVERAQQKWLVASLGLMAIVFPLSFATDLGPADAIDLLSVLAGAILPVAIGIAVLRYHVFEIDRVVSRGIAYGLLTAVLVATYAAVILLLQGPLGSFLGGDTVSVALSTLVVAALFQPLRGRLQRCVDRRFDRARFDADLTSAAFSERLRDEVDIATVTADLARHGPGRSSSRIGSGSGCGRPAGERRVIGDRRSRSSACSRRSPAPSARSALRIARPGPDAPEHVRVRRRGARRLRSPRASRSRRSAPCLSSAGRATSSAGSWSSSGSATRSACSGRP